MSSSKRQATSRRTPEEREALLAPIREKFERTLSKSKLTGPWNFNKITMNGQFSRYTDPDTDNAWIGWMLCLFNQGNLK